jgi:putative FmdB family regulatory protein
MKMPLYEYRCEDCGNEFELRRSIRALDEPAPCPECSSSNAKRQVSLFMSFTAGAEGQQSIGSGCGCGGMCSCGGHDLN